MRALRFADRGPLHVYLLCFSVLVFIGVRERRAATVDKVFTDGSRMGGNREGFDEFDHYQEIGFVVRQNAYLMLRLNLKYINLILQLRSTANNLLIFLVALEFMVRISVIIRNDTLCTRLVNNLVPYVESPNFNC